MVSTPAAVNVRDAEDGWRDAFLLNNPAETIKQHTGTWGTEG